MTVGIMAVAIVDTGGSKSAGAPRRVFSEPYNGNVAISGFDVTADGSRAILVRDEFAVTLKQINIIMNWQEELRQHTRSAAK